MTTFPDSMPWGISHGDNLSFMRSVAPRQCHALQIANDPSDISEDFVSGVNREIDKGVICISGACIAGGCGWHRRL